MTKKALLSALALILALSALALGPADQVLAQANGLTMSLAGCTVTVSFVATDQTTYFFDVFNPGLVSEQSYTPFGPDELPADVSFSYTYSGGFPAPGLTIVLSASDDVLQQFDVSGDALTTSCQPPAPDDEPPVPVALATCGPDLSDAVVGSIIAPADLYVAPGQLTNPLYGLTPGTTAWVLGMDASGEYYKIEWACQQLWVLAETMAPNYDAVWNGMPLPTNGVD